MAAKRKNDHKRLIIILIIITLVFIWGNSMIPGKLSSDMTDWLKGVLSKLFPFMKGEEQASSGHLLRKCMHFTEYMILGIEMTCLKNASRKLDNHGVLLMGLLAAMIDETIQLFTPGRAGMLQDVWLDSAGFLTGFVIVTFIRKILA